MTPPAPAPAAAVTPEAPKASWFNRLKQGLRKTGGSIAQVFTGTRIDDALYEDLESALLMADTGVGATEHLLADLVERAPLDAAQRARRSAIVAGLRAGEPLQRLG